MKQSGGFLGRLLGPLLKTGLPLIKNVIKPLAKNVLIPSGLTAAAPVAGAGIHKKILGSGNNNNTILMISNDEMKKIIESSMKILVCYDKELVKKFKMKLKNKEEDFLVCY